MTGNSILVLEVQGNAETVYNYGWTIAYYQAYNIRSAAGGVRWRCTGVGSLDRTEYQVVPEYPPPLRQPQTPPDNVHTMDLLISCGIYKSY